MNGPVPATPTAALLARAFTHLARLSDDTALFEHARYATPRREHGYCLDDVARGLVVLCRDPGPEHSGLSATVYDGLTERYLAFTTHAQSTDGRFHNRMSVDRRWQDKPGLGDWWGRGLWGLGTAAVRSPLPWIRQSAAYAFEDGVHQRSTSLRAMAFASLGAAEILSARPAHQGAIDLLVDSAKVIGGRGPGSGWPWPEERLAYANAVMPEVLIAAGQHLHDATAADHGLELLDWLLTTETRSGHLSPTGCHGWGRGEPRPAFDQQPIEAAALADACARAFAVSGDERWKRGVGRSVDWFLGENDGSIPLYDPATGGGYDGLLPHGPSENQGAESTLAFISALQQGIAIASPR